MRILITGGAGFIGSHLCDFLVDKGMSVVAIDDLSSGRRANIAHLIGNDDFEFIEARAEGEILNSQVESADIVFHLAATVGVFNVIDSPARTIENNVDATRDVLRAACKNKTKVVLASTSEVYGKTSTIASEDADIILGPTSKSRWSYAASKMVDEFLALGYHSEFGVPAIVCRFFNTIGPRQVGRYGMVVPRFLGQALRNENLTVYGDGTQSRCFTYVGDVVQWLWELANNKNAIGQVFNLGCQEEISIKALAEKVIELTGADVGMEFIPYGEAYDAGFEETQRRIPDTTKVTKLTQYYPQVPLEVALERIRAWLVAEIEAELPTQLEA